MNQNETKATPLTIDPNGTIVVGDMAIVPVARLAKLRAQADEAQRYADRWKQQFDETCAHDNAFIEAMLVATAQPAGFEWSQGPVYVATHALRLTPRDNTLGSAIVCHVEKSGHRPVGVTLYSHDRSEPLHEGLYLLRKSVWSGCLTDRYDRAEFVKIVRGLCRDASQPLKRRRKAKP